MVDKQRRPFKRTREGDELDAETADKFAGTKKKRENSLLDSDPSGDPRGKLTQSHVKNSVKRQQLYQKAKSDNSLLRIKRKRAARAAEKAALKAGEAVPPKAVPNTIESLRVPDETFVLADDEEVEADEGVDDFASYFDGRLPKVLFTTNVHPTQGVLGFVCNNLLKIFPNSSFSKRGTYGLKDVLKYASNRDFTDVIVVNENRKKVNGMLICHLPNGPSAMFKLSNVVPCICYAHCLCGMFRLCSTYGRVAGDITGHGTGSSHRPELILNNFKTRLGHTVGRMVAALFPQNPEFTGRRAVTFHNQRDFIFFRHHRYIFENDVKVRIQECGPRFTMRLRALQKGLWDKKEGQYEFVYKSENDKSRRKFIL